jgi:serine/threonine protein kinase
VTLAKSPTGCENINRFLGVADFGHEWGVAPSIVTESVRHGSLEYSQGRSFSVKLDIVSLDLVGGETWTTFLHHQVQQLANGLRHMHSMNLVHGDIKPVIAVAIITARVDY